MSPAADRWQAFRRVLPWIREQLTIDRIPTGPTISRRWLVWVLIAALWALGWGTATYRAVTVLLGHGQEFLTRTVTTAHAGMAVFLCALVLVAVALVFLGYGYPRRRSRDQAPTRRAWLVTNTKTFSAYLLCVLVGFLAALALGDLLGDPFRGYPQRPPQNDLAEALRVLSSGLAGPTEELALLAIPVLLLRRAGYSWTVVIITATVLRVPFHLYYGWGGVGLGLWAILAVLLYRRTGAVVGLILLHSTYNLLGAAPPAVAAGVLAAIALTGLVVIVAAFWKGCLRHPQPVTDPVEPATPS